MSKALFKIHWLTNFYTITMGFEQSIEQNNDQPKNQIELSAKQESLLKRKKDELNSLAENLIARFEEVD